MEVGKYHSKKYGWAWQEKELLLQPYLKSIGNLRNKTILDVGCGFGWLTKLLASKSSKVVGVDYNPDFIERAKEDFAGKNISYYCMDADGIDKITTKFDLIVSSIALHAVSPFSKLTSVLKKCRDLLKNKGEMIILVPHPCFCDRNKRSYNTYIMPDSFSYFKKKQTYTVRLVGETGTSEFASNFYNLSDYTNAFKQAGLKITEIVEPELSQKAKEKYSSEWDLERKFPFYIIFKLTK